MSVDESVFLRVIWTQLLVLTWRGVVSFGRRMDWPHLQGQEIARLREHFGSAQQLRASFDNESFLARDRI